MGREEKHPCYLEVPIAMARDNGSSPRKYFSNTLPNDQSGLCISTGGVGSGGGTTGRPSEVGGEGPRSLPQGCHRGM